MGFDNIPLSAAKSNLQSCPRHVAAFHAICGNNVKEWIVLLLGLCNINNQARWGSGLILSKPKLIHDSTKHKNTKWPCTPAARPYTNVQECYQLFTKFIKGDTQSLMGMSILRGTELRMTMVINWQKVSIEHDSIKFQIEIQLWNPKL